MNYTRTILAAFVAVTLCAAYAQESSPEDAVANEAAVEPKSVQDIVAEYLSDTSLEYSETR